MRNLMLCASAVAFTITPAIALAQSPRAATYITDEEIKKVNSLPGVDPQIVSVDIGKLNEAVGIIHRGPDGRRGAWRGRRRRGAGRGRARGALWRAGRHAAGGCRHRDCAPLPDGNLHHRLGRRHAGHRRPHRERPQVGARQRGDEGAERAVLQRHHRRSGRRQEAGEDGRRHHHSCRRATRLDRHRRPRGLPERATRFGSRPGEGYVNPVLKKE